VYSCAWSLVAEPGQQIRVSWRLPTSHRARGRDVRLQRPLGAPCSATLVLVDDVCSGTLVLVDGRVESERVEATTCSVGARTQTATIYTSRTNRLSVRPTEHLLATLLQTSSYHLATLLQTSSTDWKPHLIEYQGACTGSGTFHSPILFP